ncbi:MAG TPA: PTS sugar transporter subunit IIA [Syntrophorhabdaceae bacterium]|nr:PTS sugar transporter subunit IIA [Syntrophorhabdaceae bacterium]HNT67818.1 PTS sugar transporter subunit IIA [Syntrophorhabdaceae bacterium]
MKIAEILQEQCVVADIRGKTKKEIITELVEALANARLVKDVEPVVNVVMDREKLGSTGIGNGVAVPHGKLKNINNIMCAFGRSQNGVDFDAVDRAPVHIFFLVLAPEDSASLHLKVLSRITKILRDQSLRKKIIKLTNVRELYTSILEEDEKI